MSSFIVNQATIEDLDEVAHLFNEYRIFYEQESDLEESRHFLFDLFEHRESVIFLVNESDSNIPVGFTQLYPLFSSISITRSWILNDLFVVEDYRRRGIAQLLLDSAKQYAKQTKATVIELSTAIDNEKAQKLYERNGYKKDNQFFHYYLDL